LYESTICPASLKTSIITSFRKSLSQTSATSPEPKFQT
jgi:hypothetical protein